jgi:hypothetical protein
MLLRVLTIPVQVTKSGELPRPAESNSQNVPLCLFDSAYVFDGLVVCQLYCARVLAKLIVLLTQL